MGVRENVEIYAHMTNKIFAFILLLLFLLLWFLFPSLLIVSTLTLCSNPESRRWWWWWWPTQQVRPISQAVSKSMSQPANQPNNQPAERADSQPATHWTIRSTTKQAVKKCWQTVLKQQKLWYVDAIVWRFGLLSLLLLPRFECFLHSFFSRFLCNNMSHNFIAIQWQQEHVRDCISNEEKEEEEEDEKMPANRPSQQYAAIHTYLHTYICTYISTCIYMYINAWVKLSRAASVYFNFDLQLCCADWRRADVLAVAAVATTALFKS